MVFASQKYDAENKKGSSELPSELGRFYSKAGFQSGRYFSIAIEMAF